MLYLSQLLILFEVQEKFCTPFSMRNLNFVWIGFLWLVKKLSFFNLLRTGSVWICKKNQNVCPHGISNFDHQSLLYSDLIYTSGHHVIIVHERIGHQVVIGHWTFMIHQVVIRFGHVRTGDRAEGICSIMTKVEMAKDIDLPIL